MNLFKTLLFVVIAVFTLLFTACQPNSISPEEKSIDKEVLDGKKSAPKENSNVQIRMYFDDGSTELFYLKAGSSKYQETRKYLSGGKKVNTILLKASANVSVGFLLPNFPGSVQVRLKKGETRGYTRGEVNSLFKPIFQGRRDVDTVSAKLF